jgi:hypothetical protein
LWFKLWATFVGNSVIPYVNNNSETWTELSQCMIDRLEGLRNQFLRALLATPKSTPTPALAYEIAAIQSEMGYPGLVKECNSLIVEMRLADIRCKTLGKLQWKKAVYLRLLLKKIELIC